MPDLHQGNPLGKSGPLCSWTHNLGYSEGKHSLDVIEIIK